jgi:hypothetical protein
MKLKIIFFTIVSIFSQLATGEIINDAELAFKIILKKAPTTRPQTVAYISAEKKYYIADGGLAPMGSAYEAPISKSLIHTYDDQGKYLDSTKPGFDNRSIYFNQKTFQLETITYNISSQAGFAPMTGIFSLERNDEGFLTGKSKAISNFAPAFGSASTMPTYDFKKNLYYAKQEKLNEVLVVDAKDFQLKNTIKLDFKTPDVEHHDVAASFIAYTGEKDFEFILLDIDHKRFLIYDISGNYKGSSKLPKNLKIRAKNHFNGLGYTNNGYFFIYIDSETEHGAYHAYKVLN